ncbi:MAG: hypothetical protein MR384_13295 [Lachnospiraceae bacterium]|nr:hypothetical protein [Lachnospiraceae bacterium]
MNKELKEVVDRIKFGGDYGQISNGCCILLTEDVNTLISAIEKQDELIKYLRRSCERKDESIISMRDEDTELASKVEQQEKIINLMTKWIYEDDSSFGYGNLSKLNTKEKIKQYFENKAKEVKND